MLRLLFRFIGLLTLAAAFAALVVDGTRSVAAGAFAPLPFGKTAALLFPHGFESAHKFVDAHAPKLWDQAIVPVLAMPSWLVLGVLGLVLFAVTRRPKPKIGYSRR